MTSPRARQPRQSVDEQAFLTRQKAELRLAMRGAFRSLWDDTRAAAAPDRWVKQFPLASMGVAAATGYVAARGIKRWGSHEQSPPAEADSPAPPRPEPASSRRHAWLSVLVRPVVQILQTLVTSTISDIFRGDQPPPAKEPAP